MTLILTAGQLKELNVSLTPIKVIELLVSIELIPEVTPPSPSVIYVGQMMQIQVTVTNIGAYSAEPTLSLYINDVQQGPSYETGIIAPGNDFRFVWHYNPPTVGTYVVRAVVNEFEATDSFSAIEAPPGIPNMTISIITSVEEWINSYIIMDAIVRNNGNGGGNWEVKWYFDGTLWYTRSGYLAAGAQAFADAAAKQATIVGKHTIKVIFDWNGQHKEDTRTVIIKAY